MKLKLLELLLLVFMGKNALFHAKSGAFEGNK